MFKEFKKMTKMKKFQDQVPINHFSFKKEAIVMKQ